MGCLKAIGCPFLASLQAGSARKDIHQQALAVRLLHTLLESLSHANKSPETPWADVLVPGVPALAQLLVVDAILAQAKGKQPVGQPARSHTGQVDRAALQLEAAYLLLFILENFSPQVRSLACRLTTPDNQSFLCICWYWWYGAMCFVLPLYGLEASHRGYWRLGFTIALLFWC